MGIAFFNVIFFPLQGFLNMIVFVRPKVLRWKDAHPELSTSRIFWNILRVQPTPTTQRTKHLVAAGNINHNGSTQELHTAPDSNSRASSLVDSTRLTENGVSEAMMEHLSASQSANDEVRISRLNEGLSNMPLDTVPENNSEFDERGSSREEGDVEGGEDSKFDQTVAMDEDDSQDGETKREVRDMIAASFRQSAATFRRSSIFVDASVVDFGGTGGADDPVRQRRPYRSVEMTPPVD